jgi:UDPglucose 6-dehydrogenase
MNYHSEVGVVGTGFVGKAVLKHFKGAAFYSLHDGDFNRVNKMKYVFLCLPTPYDEKVGFDTSALEEVISRLSPSKNIIIKSTVLPGTTDKFAERYPEHDFFFNPEFLRADSAMHDFMHPDRQIVGFTKKHKVATDILNLLPRAEAQFICEAKEAEMAKLIGNCYLSMRVVFANQMYDYCQMKGVNYDSTIEMVKYDPRIGTSHWEVFGDGYRGYSGHCFPKDMGATIKDSGSELLKTVHKLNDTYFKLP